MGFKKSQENENVRNFKSFLEAKEALNTDELSKRLDAVEYLISHKEFYYVLNLLNELFKKDKIEDHPIIDAVFARLKTRPKRSDDFNELFKMLKSDNAYLRNQAITFLQNYNQDAENFIKKLLQDSDKDIRIFAVNILGDAKLENTLEPLRDFIKAENELNPLMTAVDYMGEIGEEEDIELLINIKEKFADEPFVIFAVDLAINKIKGR